MEKSYAAAMAAVKTAPKCVICDHPEREAIERSRAEGRPYTMIARVLKQIGSFPDGMTPRSAARRVTIHFDEHGR